MEYCGYERSISKKKKTLSAPPGMKKAKKISSLSERGGVRVVKMRLHSDVFVSTMM